MHMTGSLLFRVIGIFIMFFLESVYILETIQDLDEFKYSILSSIHKKDRILIIKIDPEISESHNLLE